VDEVWVDMAPEFDGKRFQSVARGQVDLDKDVTPAPEQEQQRKDFGPFLEWMATKLEADVKEVRLSSRLTTSPACIVTDEQDMTPALQRMLRAMGQEVPATKGILELNPTHPLVTRLRQAHEDRPDDDTVTGTVELLYGTAVLAEGGELATGPVRASGRRRLEHTLARRARGLPCADAPQSAVGHRRGYAVAHPHAARSVVVHSPASRPKLGAWRN
jgi:HSP90 family molecular chaperone